MKKLLLLVAVAVTFFACGRGDNKHQKQAEEQTIVVPPGMPVAPTIQTSPTTELSFDQNATTSSLSAPVLQLEEGQPLDLSQLNGEHKTFGEQAAKKIDSIRYFADQGLADYQYLYAACLENGWGVNENAQEAAKWYQKAVDQQQKVAYNALGNLYRTGKGVKRDDKEAFKLFKLGTDANDSQAMLNLGNCYYFGLGTEKNLSEAVHWWQQSADNGNAYAMAQMGDCYFYGMGVERNMEKAVACLTQAADNNIAGAQYRLGILYYAGQGVNQDLSYSKLLLTKASDGGMKEAQEFLDKQFNE